MNAPRVRMAPSPTGPFHIGSARTALFNWLFARQHGGTFVLRIEDTDRARSENRYEKDILDGLTWLGITWDEGPHRQSERTNIYKRHLEQLLAKGDAYYCYCSKEELEAQRDAMVSQGLPPRYNGRCRNLAAPPHGKSPEVIRFKVPETTITFHDIIRGKVSFDAGLFGDIVIAKNLETPLYNFTVVVDDELMNISHVIRGEDHLSNTPKQILFQRALGFTEPQYAHIPLILNPDRSKMSKRFSDTALSEYRERGYLPDATINFLALLGWHPKGDREIMSRDELIKEFDLKRVQVAGAVFNQEKMDWLNREYLKQLDEDELVSLARPFIEKVHGSAGHPPNEDFIKKLIAVERGRASRLSDFAKLGGFFFTLPAYDAKLLIWKDSTAPEAREILTELVKQFETVSGADFTRDSIASMITMAVEKGRKRGVVLWPLRVALSGLAASPDPLDIATVLGKKESERRIALAIEKLK